MTKKPNRILVPGGIEEYISKCPVDVQSKLKEMRKAIRTVAPDAIETLSYFQFPGYAYEGYDYSGMFAWFSFKDPYIRLHVRPPVIKNHAEELVGSKMATGAVSFPKENEINVDLVKRMVQASIDVMKDRA